MPNHQLQDRHPPEYSGSHALSLHEALSLVLMAAVLPVHSHPDVAMLVMGLGWSYYSLATLVSLFSIL